MRNAKSLALCLIVLSLVLPELPAAANDNSESKLPPPPPQVELISPLFTKYLKWWNCNIIDNHDGSVTLSGHSQANQVVDQIWVCLYLQQWNGSQWVNVAGGNRTTDDNSDFASRRQWLRVSPGCYYRTMAQHQAIEHDVSDPNPPATSTSNYVFIE